MARAAVERATPPPTRELRKLRDAAGNCTACPLYRNATQTVFGEGPRDADVVLVGEQPGDEEDRVGRPFVGPAGRLLDRALAEAGIARERCWVTNAVKHFKWTARGARRIHAKPTSREIAACRPWLEAELASLAPSTLVCLGATAAAAVLGPSVRVMRDRGRPLTSSFAPRTFVTIHPSAILRARDDEARRTEFARLVDDLRAALTPRGATRRRVSGGACGAVSGSDRPSAPAPSRPCDALPKARSR
jgi:DNA polymerase